MILRDILRFSWDLWRKNRCALMRGGFNMPLIFARSINLNLAKWFCCLSSLSSPSLAVSLSLSLCLTLYLSSNASLTNIITSCCEEIFVSTIFPIFYWIIYTVYHSFIYICTLGIYWALFWELFCNTFVRIKIFQFNIQCTKNSRTLCGQEDEQSESVLDCKVPCNLN